MKRLAIYCGSATPEDPRYIELARNAGIPGVVGSAKATAGLMLADLAVSKEG